MGRRDGGSMDLGDIFDVTYDRERAEAKFDSPKMSFSFAEVVAGYTEGPETLLMFAGITSGYMEIRLAVSSVSLGIFSIHVRSLEDVAVSSKHVVGVSYEGRIRILPREWLAGGPIVDFILEPSLMPPAFSHKERFVAIANEEDLWLYDFLAAKQQWIREWRPDDESVESVGPALYWSHEDGWILRESFDVVGSRGGPEEHYFSFYSIEKGDTWHVLVPCGSTTAEWLDDEPVVAVNYLIGRTPDGVFESHGGVPDPVTEPGYPHVNHMLHVNPEARKVSWAW